MFFRTPFLLPWLFGNLIWRIPVRGKQLFLTFDDGPVPGPTEFVLGELRKRNTRATFFCIGDNIAKHPDIFARVCAEGHSIGNHTYNHLNGWTSSTNAYVDNVLKCRSELLTRGCNTTLFRPPYGRIKRTQVRALEDYRIVMWDVLTHDYDATFTPENCLRASIRATRPGSIIVFHDSIKAERNMAYVLPRWMDHFLGLGYSFHAIPNP